MVGSWSRRCRWGLAALSLLLSSCSSEPELVCHCGPYYTYVASELSVPTSSAEAQAFGLDVDGDKIPDNQLGQLFAALSAQGFDVAGANAAAIDRGDLILLADLDAITSTKAAGLQLRFGDKASAVPAPCAGAADTSCRQHLNGTGSFSLSTDSPESTAVAGKIVGGQFWGGGTLSEFSLELALLSRQPIRLDLIGARAKATGLAASGIESLILAGAIPETDLQARVLPALHAQLASAVAMDCAGGAPPACGCTAGSSGRRILDVFDAAPQDCAVTPAEIASHPQLQDYLAPDVEIDGEPAVSLGIELSLIRATLR